MISTGMDGPALLRALPRSSNIARTLPGAVPETKAWPGTSVPCWMMTVASGPFWLSRRASRTTPWAGTLGLALSSRTSARRRIISRRSSMFFLSRAETETLIVLPPQSSTRRLSLASCCLTRSMLASGLSILLMATMMGTLAARAWSMASLVWGMTPSSAATTRTTMSVTLAPRARRRVKASWPGVSTKVIGPVLDRDPVGADVLGDAARFLVDEVRGADGVEERRLAVVDVAHDRDDGRARDEVGGPGLGRLPHGPLEGRELGVEVRGLGDGRGQGLVGEVVEVGGEALGGELLDEVAGLDLHPLGHVPEGQALPDDELQAGLRAASLAGFLGVRPL